MTETEWQNCTEPNEMLAFLGPRVTLRKWRLFAVACCRSVWHLLDKQCRRSLVHAEAFADGLVRKVDLKKCEVELRSHLTHLISNNGLTAYHLARTVLASCLTRKKAAKFVRQIVVYDYQPLEDQGGPWDELGTVWAMKIHDEFLCQLSISDQDPDYVRLYAELFFDNVSAINQHCSNLLRDCIRPPHVEQQKFRLSDANSAAVRELAQYIYCSRRFEDMPILADALEDNGCIDHEILDHCRRLHSENRLDFPDVTSLVVQWEKETGQSILRDDVDRPQNCSAPEANSPQRHSHVRGCWVLDLILGKE